MERYKKLERDPQARETGILALWREQGTFEQSLAATKDGPRYVFYEGPPTANGMPHFGHLMPRVYKDLFPRYKTMQGFYVARKGGWDTHGLPVELGVERDIGVNSKPEIEAYGVERFVEKCKESVWRYRGEWERMIDRMGFWIDLENAYVTYTDEYIESVWWELKTMYDRGLLYQGHKILPYCPRCGTALSSHEVAQGYRLVEDPSVAVRMPIVSDENSTYRVEKTERTALLTWTTTPWTLPANVGLAVAGDAVYVEIEQNGERLILARNLVEKAVTGDCDIVREFYGRDLVGLRYEPPYRLSEEENAYLVHSAAFVNLEEGTGIVHTAPAFGEDDYLLGREKGLPVVNPVDLAGAFTDDFPLCAGRFVKDADPEIVADLSRRGRLYCESPYEHDYPFCWRCDTPLLYYAMDSWFIKTTALKDEMIANNRKINWYPAHVGEGRLADFLANLKDWALSRDRYWGTPLNLWVCQGCEAILPIGSRADLVAHAVDKELAASVEFHRPYIDGVELTCAECGGRMKRVTNVIDTWFDSGSMHTAQWHYPFENEAAFADSFPADFICEAMEQTRGWYYTLLATSTIIHGEAPYRNCVSTGLGLDENGMKMSKSKGNVLDPWDAINRFGADCIRWYLYSSSAPWKSKRIGEAAVGEPLYRFLATLRNTHDFFALYASIDDYDPREHAAADAALTVLDRWILSRLATTVAAATEALDVYDVVSATAGLETFLDDLSNWYVRLSRRRFWRGGMGEDKAAAYGTLRTVLMALAKLLAPFVPFISEAIYQSLRGSDDPASVHLCRYPQRDALLGEAGLENEMAAARKIAALGHQARNQAQVRVRQPLSRVVVERAMALSDEVNELLERELNVETIETVSSIEARFDEVPAPNFRTLGPRLGPVGQKAAAWIKKQSAAELRAAFASGSISIELDGSAVELLPGDVTYEAALPAGVVLAGEGKERLLLDVRLDERLRRKGLVREIVHRVQVARKDAGFDVTDRIVFAYEGEGTLVSIVEENGGEIASEILATDITGLGVDAQDYTGTIDLDEGCLRIGLSRTGSMEG